MTNAEIGQIASLVALARNDNSFLVAFKSLKNSGVPFKYSKT